MCTLGFALLYDDCQEPNSGNSRVLPVSVIVLPDDGALADDDGGELELLELLQAAASTVSGTRTAAVVIKRIRLVTGRDSFDWACLWHALCDSRAGRARMGGVRASARVDVTSRSARRRSSLSPPVSDVRTPDWWVRARRGVPCSGTSSSRPR